MILSAQTIRQRCHLMQGRFQMVIEPFCERTVENGMSYGLSIAGYDIRIKDATTVWPGVFSLATTVERFEFPKDVMGMLCDKSSWARRGIAVQNTIFEPGWKGFPTLELSNHGDSSLLIPAGAPIAQMIFHLVDQPVEKAYSGKYQNQEQRPIAAIDEK